MGILKNAANMTMWGRLDEARQRYRRAEAVWRAYLVSGVAFAVGFSERLAKDIIVRISGDKAAPSE